MLTWLRGGADTPQSKRLKEIFYELEIPDCVTDPQADTPRDFSNLATSWSCVRRDCFTCQ